MKISLQCPAGHRWTYEGLAGDFASSHIEMQTDCPECGRMVAFTVDDGVVSGPGAVPGPLRVRWPAAILDGLRRRS